MTARASSRPAIGAPTSVAVTSCSQEVRGSVTTRRLVAGDSVAVVRSADRGALTAPALCLGSSTPLKRALSPGLIRAAAVRAGAVMRLDIHPADFDLPRHVATLEALLDRAAGRAVVTYDQLVA